ncbi:hypothetical protein O181_076873 [Austropuccinia psidii MF-1]|uniref:Uncharacterized protein n=1 Tax=Austropuccinia psidii MF-1 TaxID=1389203 RepID=A0A9Q3ID75_9BASI|nr:hypothetical protein [Austropuccinia psidii MF-1]
MPGSYAWEVFVLPMTCQPHSDNRVTYALHMTTLCPQCEPFHRNTARKSVTLHMQRHLDVARASLSLLGVTVAETAVKNATTAVPLPPPVTTPPFHNNIHPFLSTPSH